MNMTQVRYVLAVAQYHSFTRAAESLFMTQPALSLQISCLEKELGLRLFRRTSHGAVLTQDGEAFVLDAQPLMKLWNRLQDNMKNRNTHPAGHLRIALGARVYSNGLFAPIVRFFDEHPELEVTFVTEISGNFLEELQNETLDAALDRLPPRKLILSSDGLAASELVRERQCVLLSPDDPRSQMSHLPFKAMQGCAIATGPEGSLEDRTIRQDCLDLGVHIGKVYRCDNVSALMSLIRSGKGVALGPLSFRDYFQIAAVPVLPAVEISLSFICLRRNWEDPRLSLLRRYLEDLCTSHNLEQKLNENGK